MSIETFNSKIVDWSSLKEPSKAEEKEPAELNQEISQQPVFDVSYDELLKEGLFKEAEAAATEIGSEYYRIIAFIDIYRELKNRGHLDQALLLSRTHLKGHFVSRTLSSICWAKIKAGQLGEALEIAEMISDELSKEPVLSAISRALVEMGEAQKSTSVVYMISNELSRSLTFEANSIKLVEMGRIDDALEVANKITNDYGKRRALAPIQEAVEKSGDKKKAEELLGLISSLPHACID